MKLILVEPNIEGRVSEPSLNLALLKSFINERTNHEAKIVDLTFHKDDWISYVRNEIKNFDCDLIGISCLSFNYHQALEVASVLKENFDIKIIFGGIHSILSPEQVIENEVVDIVCTGEGEHILKDLLDNNINCENIKGIWYKENGKVIKNPKRRLIENLDELPFPDWDDFELEKYFDVNVHGLPVMASRGCPYNCTFCAAHALRKATEGRWVRIRSVDSVIEEVTIMIEKYYDRGLKIFMFEDNTFTVSRDFVINFCKRYKELGFHKKVLWSVATRADRLTEEIVKEMKEAGCFEIGIGVESADDYIRNVVYKKGISMEQIMNAIKWIRKYELQLHIPIIIGSPYDTVEIMENNLKFAKEVSAEAMIFPVLMPLPKTEIREMCIKEGLIDEDLDFKTAHIMHTQTVARTKYASKDDVQRIVKKARRYLMTKAFFDGLRMKGPRFLFDIIVFFLYYKPKYKLETDNAWKFTVGKYNLERFRKERCS